MTFAAVQPWIDQTFVDRSLGTEAEDLREELKDAAAPPGVDRKSNISIRLFEAVRAADRDGTSLSLHTFGRAFTFLASLPAVLPLPFVIVESENEIGLDWDESPERVVAGCGETGVSTETGEAPV